MSPVTRTRWVTFGCYGTLVDRTDRPARQVLPHVEPMLAELRRRGYKLAVLTNCDDALFEQTHRAFRQPFDLFVTAERVGGRKPDRWHFRAFQMMARVCPSDWAHVAANWTTDIAPARELGLNAVWLEDPAAASDVPAAIDDMLGAGSIAGDRYSLV